MENVVPDGTVEVAIALHMLCEMDGDDTDGPSEQVHVSAVPELLALTPLLPEASVATAITADPAGISVVDEQEIEVVDVVLVAVQTSDGGERTALALPLVSNIASPSAARLRRAKDVNVQPFGIELVK